jgi:ATP-binding cassette, subfamily B, bacterial
MVLADHTTFTDTVANNIGCGDSFTRPQIVEAAKVAHAHGFVQQLPSGYETVVGGSGYSLRPGERFRIALARAVLRDPAVLVLEEPTEPYDPDSAALIDDAIARLQPGRTIIILARRSSTVKKADAVVVIQDGKVAGGEADTAASASQTHKALAGRK